MNTRRIILIFGLLFGGISVGLSLVQFYGGWLYQNTLTTRLVFGIIPIFLMLFCIAFGIYYAQRLYRIQVVTFSNERYLRFSQMLKIGLGITLVGALLIAVYHLVLITWLDPDFMQKSIEIQLAQQKMLMPEMTESELIENQKNMQENATPFRQFNLSLVGNMFFGFFITLGVSALMKLLQKTNKPL